MRITTFDDDVSGKLCGVEVPLRRLAASPKPLEAAYWQKLLELVEYLQSSGPEPELWGYVVLQELMLAKPDQPDPIRDLEMKEFMDEWRALNPDPTTWGDSFYREMRQLFRGKPGICVRIRVDWRDYAPLRDGIPEMHYRLEVERPGKTVTEDARAKDVAEVERLILQAFG